MTERMAFNRTPNRGQLKSEIRLTSLNVGLKPCKTAKQRKSGWEKGLQSVTRGTETGKTTSIMRGKKETMQQAEVERNKHSSNLKTPTNERDHSV